MTLTVSFGGSCSTRVLSADTEFANQSIVQTILGTALSEEYTLAFNYASLALNNSYFLDNLVRLTLTFCKCFP